MGRDDNGAGAVARQPLEHIEHDLGRVGVEVAGRLVGEQETRLVGEGTRDGNALILATAERVGPMPSPILEPHRPEQLARPGSTTRP